MSPITPFPTRTPRSNSSFGSAAAGSSKNMEVLAINKIRKIKNGETSSNSSNIVSDVSLEREKREAAGNVEAAVSEKGVGEASKKRARLDSAPDLGQDQGQRGSKDQSKRLKVEGQTASAPKEKTAKDRSEEEKKESEVDLVCPACLESPRKGPVYQCSNGHLICEDCQPKVANCPTCREKNTGISNLIVERILEIRLKSSKSYDCRSTANGCTFKLPMSLLLLHESMCVFRTVPCPDKHSGACNWTGPLHGLINHVAATKCAQIIHLDDSTGSCDSVICDFNTTDSTVFGWDATIHWKPIVLISGAHMRLFGYLVIYRDLLGEWLVSARSYCGKALLENIRVRVTLKRPSAERAVMESAKWDKAANGNYDKSNEEAKNNDGAMDDATQKKEADEEDEVEEDASYNYVGKMLAHDTPDKNVIKSGEFISLRDAQVKRLCRGKTLFQCSAEIFERVEEGQMGFLSRPWFAASYGRPFVNCGKVQSKDNGGAGPPQPLTAGTPLQPPGGAAAAAGAAAAGDDDDSSTVAESDGGEDDVSGAEDDPDDTLRGAQAATSDDDFTDAHSEAKAAAAAPNPRPRRAVRKPQRYGLSHFPGM